MMLFAGVGVEKSRWRGEAMTEAGRLAFWRAVASSLWMKPCKAWQKILLACS